MMSRILLLIGFGGFIGSIARYLSNIYLLKVLPENWPLVTVVVNFVGCLLMGFVAGISDRYTWITPEWRLFLTVGICGGYTTFSAFAYENIRFLQAGNYLLFAMNSLLSFILALAGVLIGLALAKIGAV